MEKPSKANEVMRQLLDTWRSGKLTDLLEAALIKRVTGADCPSDNWSLRNQILMLMQGTSDARGFNQWKQAARNVRKGCHAIYILGPSMKKVEKANGEEDFALVGFHGVPVFRVEDTDGDALPSYNPRELPPLYEVAARLGVSVQYAPAPENGNTNHLGVYFPGRKAIRLLTHEPSVFLHELAHAIDDHLKGMARGSHKGSAAYNDNEVVAQTCANALARIYGIDVDGHSLKYVEAFANERDAFKAVNRLLSRIEKVIDFAMGNTETEAQAAPELAQAA